MSQEHSYVYILECADHTYYTGWTTDIAKRVKCHNDGKGAKYTRCRCPVSLVYLEKLENKSAGLKREAAIKKMTRREKEMLVRECVLDKDLLSILQ